MSWAFLADGALLEGQGSLAPVEVSFGVLLDALCPPTHAIVWALALASAGARLLGRSVSMVGGWSAPDEQPAALGGVPGGWVMKWVHDFAPAAQGRGDKMTPSQRGAARVKILAKS